MSPRQYRQQVLKGVILPDPFESDRKIERVAFSRKKDEKNLKKGLTFQFESCIITHVADATTTESGCGAAGSALDWGSRGREFKSRHSDQKIEIRI